MGFLDVGTPLSWRDSQEVIAYVSSHGIEQLLHIWALNRNRHDRTLCWGEEIEYSLVSIESSSQETRVYSNASEIIEELQVREHIRPRRRTTAHLLSEWHPEFANHMIEALPSPPYILNVNSLLMLEPSMRLRRAKIQSVLTESKYVTSQTVFPRFGLNRFIDNSKLLSHKNWDTNQASDEEQTYAITESVFIPDCILNPHPRFPTLVSNIKSRRRANPYILIPIYKDVNTCKSSDTLTLKKQSSKNSTLCFSSATHTKDAMNNGPLSPFAYQDDTLYENDWSLAQNVNELDRYKVEKLARKSMNPVKDHIYMDCFAFGMGMSCVQTTFACETITVARYLYDQLVVLAPLFLVLTASTPYQRGLLSDYDTRWATLEQAVDCRTFEEESEPTTKKQSENSNSYIPKSRYSAVSLYISDCDYLKLNERVLNDTCTPINSKAYAYLMQHDMDHLLAKHFAHLWIRDPLVIFKEKVYLDDTKAVDHFENIQSTNWNSVRFKPPPPPALNNNVNDSNDGIYLSPIGWRVEFRSPEVQLTDFDNAAGVALISVLVQCILYYRLNLYIPMSLNDINMKRSWNRNAINHEKFFFRRNVSPDHADMTFKEADVVEMSLYEILAGSEKHDFIGLIPLCEKYIQETQTTVASKQTTATAPAETNSILTEKKQKLKNEKFEHDDTVKNKTQNWCESCCDLSYGYEARLCFAQYSSLFIDRAAGRRLTGAQFLRKFVVSHPQYQHDSVVSPIMSHDLTVLSTLLGFGVLTAPDLHGDLACKHLILQTPLPATIQLPHFSQEALEMLHIVPISQQELVTTYQHPFAIKLYEKPIIALNAINSIYTMPIGVTARANQFHKLLAEEEQSQPCKSCSNRDLFQLTLDLLDHNKPRSSDVYIEKNNNNNSNRSIIHNVISNEEFTQAWILKDIDYVGCTTTDYSHGTSTNPACIQSDASATSKKQAAVDLDKVSTICPSSVSDNCSLIDEDDRMHELSRSLNLGFGNEQELEYFQQVCGSSA